MLLTSRSNLSVSHSLTPLLLLSLSLRCCQVDFEEFKLGIQKLGYQPHITVSPEDWDVITIQGSLLGEGKCTGCEQENVWGVGRSHEGWGGVKPCRGAQVGYRG